MNSFKIKLITRWKKKMKPLLTNFFTIKLILKDHSQRIFLKLLENPESTKENQNKITKFVSKKTKKMSKC